MTIVSLLLLYRHKDVTLWDLIEIVAVNLLAFPVWLFVLSEVLEELEEYGSKVVVLKRRGEHTNLIKGLH
jgi:hypothetical protein